MKQLLVLAALLSTCQLRAENNKILHSPWNAGPVALTDAAYRCSPTVRAAANITITGDAANGANPSPNVAYRESAAAQNAIVKQVTRATQAYQITGSRSAVQCAVLQMATAAKDNAMTGSITNLETAMRETETLQALAVAYLRLQPSGAITPLEQRSILKWMETVLHHGRTFYDHHSGCGHSAPYVHDSLRVNHDWLYSSDPSWFQAGDNGIEVLPDEPPGAGAVSNECDKQTHEYLETAVVAAAIGIAKQDKELYGWAIGQYRAAVKRIDDRGMLRYDTVRQHALKFNTASATALVQLAEFGEANGEDLYAYDKGRMHLLIKGIYILYFLKGGYHAR